jgi:aspartate kinase
MKFGGALLKDAHGTNRVAGLVEEFNCEPLVVVVSAIGKTTNALEQLCASLNNEGDGQDLFFEIKRSHLALYNELFPNGNNKLSEAISVLFDKLWEKVNDNYLNRFQAYDSIVSIGEELSSTIFYNFLNENGIEVELINATEIIKTDDNYTDAAINWEETRKAINGIVVPVLKQGKVVVTQGFIGSHDNKFTTTLGREGSDFTAAILGNVLNAHEVTIWKNVPGLMNADPARFDDAEKIDSISYHEAIELAYYGASVIHPKTIQPLKQKGITLSVRPYYDVSLTPTIISDDSTNDSKVSSVIIKDNQVLLSISTKNLSFIGEENLGNIFSIFSKNKIHVNLMQNSAVSFSVAFNYDKFKLESLLNDLGNEYILKYNTGLQLITIRHYSDSLIEKYVNSREIFLIQKSRVTVQVLVFR